MNGFTACDIPKFFCNTAQLLETETKLVHIVHLKAFLFKLDNVLLLKCMYIYILNVIYLLCHNLLHMI